MKDKNGVISFDEFVIGIGPFFLIAFQSDLARLKIEQNEKLYSNYDSDLVETVRKIFLSLDVNGDGAISVQVVNQFGHLV